MHQHVLEIQQTFVQVHFHKHSGLCLISLEQRWAFFHKLAKRKMSLILKEAQRTKAQCVFEISEAQRAKAQRISKISEAQRNLRNVF